MNTLHQSELEAIADTHVVHVVRQLADAHHELTIRVAAVENGFPGGDAEGHRRAHETMIEELEEKRKLRRAVQEKTISGLVWMFVVACGTALWNYAKEHIR
jgi:hypothetical protein